MNVTIELAYDRYVAIVTELSCTTINLVCIYLAAAEEKRYRSFVRIKDEYGTTTKIVK